MPIVSSRMAATQLHRIGPAVIARTLISGTHVRVWQFRHVPAVSRQGADSANAARHESSSAFQRCSCSFYCFCSVCAAAILATERARQVLGSSQHVSSHHLGLILLRSILLDHSHGWDPEKIAAHVGSRNKTQVNSHAQKFFQREVRSLLLWWLCLRAIHHSETEQEQFRSECKAINWYSA